MRGLGKSILKRIQGHGRGWVFTPRDFLDLGDRAAVDQVLSRLVKADQLRRLKRGLYDYPRTNPRIGQVTPSGDAITQAVVRRDGADVLVSGAQAANALGLTTQVPAQLVFYTNGPKRTIKAGNVAVDFRRTTSTRKLQWANRPGGYVVQALAWLGPELAKKQDTRRLSAQLPDAVKRDLLDGIRYVPGWMAPVIRRVATQR